MNYYGKERIGSDALDYNVGANVVAKMCHLNTNCLAAVIFRVYPNLFQVKLVLDVSAG